MKISIVLGILEKAENRPCLMSEMASLMGYYRDAKLLDVTRGCGCPSEDQISNNDMLVALHALTRSHICRTCNKLPGFWLCAAIKVDCLLAPF
jgi:hypothetical protein